MEIIILADVPFTDILTRWNIWLFLTLLRSRKIIIFCVYFNEIFAIMTYSFVSCTDRMGTNDTLVLRCTDMKWNNKLLVHLSIHMLGNNDNFFVPYTIMREINDTIGCSFL